MTWGVQGCTDVFCYNETLQHFASKPSSRLLMYTRHAPHCAPVPGPGNAPIEMGACAAVQNGVWVGLRHGGVSVLGLAGDL